MANPGLTYWPLASRLDVHKEQRELNPPNFIRSPLGACALAALLAGCGGSQSAVGVPSALSQSVGTAAKCEIEDYYRFEGSCTSGVLEPGGSTYKLAAYRGISAVFKIPKNNGKGAFTFTYADATGNGDIGKLHGKKFPLYPNPCGSSSCPGTAFVYIGVGVSGSGELKPKGNNKFTFENANGYPGTSCGEALLPTSGKWEPFGPTEAPQGKALTFKYAVDYVPGNYTVAIYCQ
jgi:hypothetical protein